jgi:hypothetical protein
VDDAHRAELLRPDRPFGGLFSGSVGGSVLDRGNVRPLITGLPVVKAPLDDAVG